MVNQYYQIPNLFILDDYDRCLYEFPSNNATYCYVDVTIKPNISSKSWSYIQNISTDFKHYYRHDRLKRGLCTRWCEEKLSQMIETLHKQYTQPIFDRRLGEIPVQALIYGDPLGNREKYKDLIDKCVNYELKEKYGLTGYSEIEYCHSVEDIYHADYLDILFLAVCVFLLTSVISSTIYDTFRKRWRFSSFETSKYYKTYPPERIQQFLTSFSLKRNWYALFMKSSDEVKAINTMKFFLSCFVILIHIFNMFTSFSIENPEYMERNYHKWISMIFINGLTAIQGYFTISGFLMAYQFCKHENRVLSFDVDYYWRTIINRLMRLYPVYLFVILLTATWIVPLNEGPVWRHYNEMQRTYCRQHSWSNILFINNYLYVNQPCLMQGWYLGADFQLFLFSLTCLMIVWKYPQFKKWILGGAIAFSIIVPALVTYIQKFDGILMVYLEEQKYYMWNDPMFQKIYTPSHTNTGCYLTGVISGWLYFKMKQNKSDLSKSKIFVFFWWWSFPLTVALLISGCIFYEFDFQKPSLWISAYSILAKHMYGILIISFIIGMAFKIGGYVCDFFTSDLFRPLGQLSFCAYLIHMFVLQVTMGNVRKPVTLSDSRVIIQLSSGIFLSYLAALLLYLFVEIPFANLQKIILPSRKVQQVTGTISTEQLAN